MVSRDVIYDHVWSKGYGGTLKIVDVYVNHLRAKLDQRFDPSSCTPCVALATFCETGATRMARISSWW